MKTQDFMNAIYDLIAQNPIAGAYGMGGEEHDHLTELIDHVDTEHNAIVFVNDKGKEFELRLVGTYAPLEAIVMYHTFSLELTNDVFTRNYEEAYADFQKRQANGESARLYREEYHTQEQYQEGTPVEEDCIFSTD